MGETLVQETRGWDEERGRTIIQRSKEEANDYRYFPEPDLPPLRPSAEWVAELRTKLPELPAQRRARYTDTLGLSAYDAGVLTSDAALAAYFDAVVEAGVAAKSAANWITGEFSRLLNQHAADALRADHVALGPQGLAELIGEVDSGGVSSTNAKTVLAEAFESGESPRAIIERRGLGQVSDAGRHRRRDRERAGRVRVAGRGVSVRKGSAVRIPGRTGDEANCWPCRRAPGERGASAQARSLSGSTWPTPRLGPYSHTLARDVGRAAQRRCTCVSSPWHAMCVDRALTGYITTDISHDSSAGPLRTPGSHGRKSQARLDA